MPKSAKKKKLKAKVNHSFKKYFIHYVYCLLIILLLSVASININHYIESQKVLGDKIDATSFLEEKTYWEAVVEKNPNYIDGYLQLAKVNVEIGNKNDAQNMIIKALELDPNNSRITSVQEELGL